MEGCFDPWALRRGRFKKNFFWHFWDKTFFKGAAAIVALTKSEAGNIRRMGLSNRVEVIPNGVDVNDFVGGATKAELLEIFPEIQGRRIVLFMSRVHPIKGILNLVKAFGQVISRHPEALLIIAGPDEGGHRKDVELCVQQENLDKYVLFTGPVYGDIKVGFLRNSTVFVLPSYSEGFPVVVPEAMACKLPVILTEGCHVPEVAEVGAGIEVDTSSQQIAYAINSLLSDNVMCKQMGDNAYQLAVERLSWKRVAQMTAELCCDVAW